MILIENIVVLVPPQHPHEELSSNSIRRGFRRARVSAKRVGTTSSAFVCGLDSNCRDVLTNLLTNDPTQC